MRSLKITFVNGKNTLRNVKNILEKYNKFMFYNLTWTCVAIHYIITVKATVFGSRGNIL